MNHTLIFTGNAGPGVVTAAAATALHLAGQGRRTLLYSLATPPAALGALLGTALGSAPAAVAPHLDALAIDPLAALSAAWEQGRAQLPAPAQAIAADELPLLPGMDALFGLQRLRALGPRYDTLVVDAGPHDGLLRLLATPDSLRWLVRLLFGLERGPGRSSASVASALLPTVFIPPEARERVQSLRIEAEQVRDELLDPARTAVHYVLRPDAAALEEARLAVPALHLHGLAVAALPVGPLLPEDVGDARLAPLAAQQAAQLAAAREVWPALPLPSFPMHDPSAGQAALRALGALLAAPPPAAPAAPISYTHEGAPAVVVALPGLAKGALQLTVSGDELIVRVGTYRRHILLPEALRGGNVRATRAGEQLIVRLR